jgi:hypothetical protein
MYQVIYFENRSEDKAIKTLEKEINRLLSNGWEAKGGISVIKDSQGFYHVYQAMVR